ncbi:hypothetical protein CVT26_009642 [Gymnopilus dilepis]|uniref:F-box domain-containing protein n=1 Tax=Gymnopilus dilepis TaxID=231916 RepID=A0A409VKQ9_9AGAR|nr:hypothetical protein CVT26_009642 [Gymnopilus dilepis]
MKTRTRVLSLSIPSYSSSGVGSSSSNTDNAAKSSSKTLRLKLSRLSLSRGGISSPVTATPSVELVSPVPHLLTSNIPPTDSERALIQDTISTVSAQNAALEASLNFDANTKPSSTTLKRLGAGQDFVHSHKAILSPVRLLPEEILAEIFSIYSESFLLEDHPHIITVSREGIIYPWIPSQVCRSWRSAALSLHHLWGQLIVDTCLWKTNKPSKSFMELFKTLVDRSHDAPLCIYFCTPPSADVEDLRPIIDTLVKNSERWSTVYLITPYSVLSAFEGIKGRLPALRRLYLSFAVEEPMYTTKETVLDTFEVAPKLQSVYLSSASFTGRMLLPYDQLLVFLDGGERANGRVREHVIPASASTLQDLSFGRFPMEDIQRPWPHSTLPELTNLIVKFENTGDEDDSYDNLQDNFFTHLTLPNVNRIDITNYPKNLLPVLSSLITRSFPAQQATTLQELSFSTYYLAEYNPGDLATFLELTPFLKKLRVYLPHTQDLERLVVIPGSDQPLLPRLEELCIFVYDSVEGCEDVLSQIARSRCEPILTNNSRNDPNAPSSTSPSPPTRLQHFRLVFPGAVLCHAGHEKLEESSRSASVIPTESSSAEPKDMEDRVALLKDWTPLASSLPSIFAFWARPARMGLKKMKRAFQVSQWFSMVEGIKIQGVKELYRSDIHHLMYHISLLPSSDLPGDNIYHFRKRARALLEKWSRLLAEDIKNRRWAFQGAQSVVYVPQDHEIRTRPAQETIESMIYGDKFYPQKYSVSWYDLQVVLQYQD